MRGVSVIAPLALAILGDSICAGFGVALGDPFPALLQQRGYDVANHCVPGTSARDWRPDATVWPFVTWPEPGTYDVLIAALGTNGSRELWGLPPLEVPEHIAYMQEILTRAFEDGAQRVLVVLPVPPPMWPEGDDLERLRGYRAAYPGELCGDVRVDCVAYELGPEHYGDLVHYNAAGHVIAADAIEVVLVPEPSSLAQCVTALCVMVELVRQRWKGK